MERREEGGLRGRDGEMGGSERMVDRVREWRVGEG